MPHFQAILEARLRADLLLLGLQRRRGALDCQCSQRQVRRIVSLLATALRPLACAGAPLGHKLAKHGRSTCAATFSADTA